MESIVLTPKLSSHTSCTCLINMFSYLQFLCWNKYNCMLTIIFALLVLLRFSICFIFVLNYGVCLYMYVYILSLERQSIHMQYYIVKFQFPFLKCPCVYIVLLLSTLIFHMQRRIKQILTYTFVYTMKPKQFIDTLIFFHCWLILKWRGCCSCNH